jgi:hypothetical protein
LPTNLYFWSFLFHLNCHKEHNNKYINNILKLIFWFNVLGVILNLFVVQPLDKMSALYSSYKAVGYVTDGTPFVLSKLGEENFLTTSIGNSFQVYRVNRLNVCLVSASISNDDQTSQTTKNITSLQSHGHETFASVGNTVVVFNRAELEEFC